MDMTNKIVLLSFIIALGLLFSCSSDSSTGPDSADPDPDEPAETTGILEVTTETDGSGTDEDGYTVTLDDSESKTVDSEGMITFEDLNEGTYTIELSGLAAGCSVEGENPIELQIVAGETTSNTFSVTCESVEPLKNKIIFARGGSSPKLYTMNPDGSDVSMIPNGNGGSPDISSDGKRIVFESDFDIYTINVDGTGRTKLTEYGDQSSNRRNMNPVWSPDGTRIAFQIEDDIYVMDADGKNESKVTTTGNNRHPDWSPDGSLIVFASHRNEQAEIFTIQPDGESEERLTVSDGENHRHPTWESEGDRIAFIKGGEIFIMDANGENDFQVTNNSSDEENLNLSWSPDGSHIVFERNTQNFQVGNLYEIFSIKTDGTELTRHTNNEEDPLVRDSEPVWSPL